MRAGRPLVGMPLRARLTLTYGLLFLLAGIVLLGLTYALFNQRFTASGAKVISRSFAAGEAGAPTPVPSPTASGSASGTPSAERVFRTAPDGSVPTGVDATNFLISQRNDLQDAASRSFLTQGGIALVVVTAVAAGLGWLIAGRVLAPLHQVTETAHRIATAPAADRGLHERIELDGPDDEVKELADTFDAMVERLDHSFDGQRRFVANASHELRTPLTLSRALVEVAMHRPSASEDLKELGGSLLEINARHERLINGLLLLAGSENQITDRAAVDLADLVTHVVAQAAGDAERHGIALSESTSEATTCGNALLLERIVHNLVENGIRHNLPERGWVHVRTRTRGDTVELEVTNSGPVISSYDAGVIFEPFRRLGGDRLVTANGVGLGLSIVRSVATAHGGTVTATPLPEGGLRVKVILPRGHQARDL